MPKLHFSKYTGCGNDFILINNIDLKLSDQDGDLFTEWCDRHFGIGADGVVLLEKSQSADFSMRIWNPDGSEAEMCGNGLRCLIKFIVDQGYPEQSYRIETKFAVHQSYYSQNGITVCMGTPKDILWDMHAVIDNENHIFHYMDTGVPHTVSFVEDSKKCDLAKFGPKVRSHPIFGKRGTNVNIASVDQEKGVITLRTFERGVEGETLACGTGVTAAALAAAYKFKMKSPIKVSVQSQDTLEVAFKEEDNQFHSVTMTGPALHIFDGTIELKRK